jgi:hypothetical protein
VGARGGGRKYANKELEDQQAASINDEIYLFFSHLFKNITI